MKPRNPKTNLDLIFSKWFCVSERHVPPSSSTIKSDILNLSLPGPFLRSEPFCRVRKSPCLELALTHQFSSRTLNFILFSSYSRTSQPCSTPSMALAHSSKINLTARCVGLPAWPIHGQSPTSRASWWLPYLCRSTTARRMQQRQVCEVRAAATAGARAECHLRGRQSKAKQVNLTGVAAATASVLALHVLLCAAVLAVEGASYKDLAAISCDLSAFPNVSVPHQAPASAQPKFGESVLGTRSSCWHDGLTTNSLAEHMHCCRCRCLSTGPQVQFFRVEVSQCSSSSTGSLLLLAAAELQPGAWVNGPKHVLCCSLDRRRCSRHGMAQQTAGSRGRAGMQLKPSLRQHFVSVCVSAGHCSPLAFDIRHSGPGGCWHQRHDSHTSAWCGHAGR